MRPRTPLLTSLLPIPNLSRHLSILTSGTTPACATTPRRRCRPFSSSTRSLANEQDHYANLGVSRSASRNEIKDKFYEVSSSTRSVDRVDARRRRGESLPLVADGVLWSATDSTLFPHLRQLSRKYHPDAPSVSSESIESRTARFQTLSQSYSVLSDDTSRRQYDATLGGSASSPFGSRPRYSSGAAHEVGRSGFGGGSGAAWSWTSAENEARRERANYAWGHPTRTRKNPRNDGHYQEYTQAGSGSGNPFHPNRDTRTSDEHFQTFAAREARMRGRGPAPMSAKAGFNSSGSSRFSTGTASFGAKADEENRLINDSSTKRTGQVALVFLTTFVIAISFSGNNRVSSTMPTNDKRRR
ncbi:BZ3500_MvSof-1268-A1-R1_Chr2-1g04567 [Microbotryum saponariae]|uniref:BZ3500_MvSof-1268-A1-R1_Chr2-1g04567 protein n=1 Tax=Microbotryum saponariae TaxID=289078 RepID=A0A2X0KFV3_9BASI|nr:BZ3500_MvSof-1268-A1-R1_Chr2-1g04567 [Microbotryum saponariae]SCZ92039.1 BZ3501_MvSof-1269-A2-R1_Chr2-1g04223 [Microbotryum saponariae]